MTRRLVLAVAAVLALLAALWLLRRDGTEPSAGSSAGGTAAPGPAARGAAALPAALPGAAPAAPAPAPRGAFEGTVLSTATGAGIAGAEVTFSRAGAAAPVHTGPGGVFRFEPPEAGRWQLATASAPGHEPFAPEWGTSPIAVDARPGEAVGGIVVWLRPVRSVAGRVEDAAGKPVSGAEVRVLGGATGERAMMPSTERATSGAGGAFIITAPDGATLEARHPGHAPGRATLDLTARSSGRVVIQLGEAAERPAPGAVTGRVVAGGAPVEGALVSARLRRRGGPGSADSVVAAQALSDADGRFTLPDLDAGRYLLGAVRDGYAQSRAVVARPGEEAVVELGRGGAVAGLVREAGSGRPLAPFRVEVRRGGRGGRFWVRDATFVDASGRFEIADVPPGPALVTAFAPGHLPSDEVEVTVPEAPGSVEVQLRVPVGGRIAGRVTDRVSGAPIAGARVALEGEGANPPSLLDGGAAAISGADGSFVVAGLPPRTVSLLASADGHHSRIVAGISVPEEGMAGPVDVRLSPVAEGEDPRVELAGIGATLEQRGRSVLRIGAVVPGGGAAEAGLVPGDEILAVEWRPISDLGLAGAVDLIRGPEDTRVRLVVRRGGTAPAEIWVWRRLVRG